MLHNASRIRVMFRLLGFDVRVRPGFVIFLGLIVFLYQDSFGVWLAGGIAAFTLLHELGHAVAARSAGADADISLDFLAGYTSFRPDPKRPISPGRRAVISAAGPFVQIAASVAVLIAMGINPVSIDSARTSDAAAAIWWAGPVIGVLNLIPVLPLDGGHLALTGLEVFLGKRAFRVMAIASLVVTGGAAVLLFGSGRGGFGIFVAFLLLNQFQILQATSKRAMTQQSASQHDAESNAWHTGRPGMLEPGQQLSPWYRAHRALVAGDDHGAARIIIDDVHATSPRRWRPPNAASPAQLRAIVDVLPEPLPHGNPYSEQVMNEIVLGLGLAQLAGSYAAERFDRQRSSLAATMVARCSAALGETDNALSWLRAANDTLADEPEQSVSTLAVTMDRAPEFAHLRAAPGFTTLRAALV